MTDRRSLPRVENPAIGDPITFRPSIAEREVILRIAKEEERTVGTVVRRLMRAGLAARAAQAPAGQAFAAASTTGAAA